MRFGDFLSLLLTSSVAARGNQADPPLQDAVSIFGVVTIAPGKYQRFVEVQNQALEYIQQNEPGTLQLELYRTAEYCNGTEIAFFEKYANVAARDTHVSSQNYAKYIATLMGEGLLVGEPSLLNGSFTQGFA